MQWIRSTSTTTTRVSFEPCCRPHTPPSDASSHSAGGLQIIRAAAVEALVQPPSAPPSCRQPRRRMSRGDVTLLAGTAGAAGAALPGQPLYPIKRVVDRAMVAIAGDGAEAARLDLRFAERRLDESAAVAGQG